MIESNTNVLWIIKWDPDLGPKTKKNLNQKCSKICIGFEDLHFKYLPPRSKCTRQPFCFASLLLRSLFHTNATSRGAGLISSVYTRNFLIGLKADFHVYFSAEYLWKILQLEKRQPWQLIFTQNTILEYNHNELLRLLVLRDL